MNGEFNNEKYKSFIRDLINRRLKFSKLYIVRSKKFASIERKYIFLKVEGIQGVRDDPERSIVCFLKKRPEFVSFTGAIFVSCDEFRHFFEYGVLLSIHENLD